MFEFCFAQCVCVCVCVRVCVRTLVCMLACMYGYMKLHQSVRFNANAIERCFTKYKLNKVFPLKVQCFHELELYNSGLSKISIHFIIHLLLFFFSSFGLCAHRTQSNADKFKKPTFVAFYDVDYTKNPKGTNYWRNRCVLSTWLAVY